MVNNNVYFLSVSSEIGKDSSHTAHFILFARPFPGSWGTTLQEHSDKNSQASPIMCLFAPQAPVIEILK